MMWFGLHCVVKICSLFEILQVGGRYICVLPDTLHVRLPTHS
jgi:hypothetical protein